MGLFSLYLAAEAVYRIFKVIPDSSDPVIGGLLLGSYSHYRRESYQQNSQPHFYWRTDLLWDGPVDWAR